MEESQNEFFYVIQDSTLSIPKVVKGVKELMDVLPQMKMPKINTLESLNDTQKALAEPSSLSSTQNTTQSQGEKLFKKEEEAKEPPLQKSTPKVEPKPVETELNKKTRKSEATQKIRDKNSVLFHFKENEREFAAAKPLVRPYESYVLYFDGGSRGNPGKAGCGYVLYTKSSTRIYSNCVCIGTATNNKAEYSGMIFGMSSALNLGVRKLEVRGDSQLIIKQMNGEYKVKNENIKPLHHEATILRLRFEEIKFSWVPREENSEADELANQAMNSR